MTDTLAEALLAHRIDMKQLHDGYGPMLRIVNLLIGVVPICDSYLEIWRPGFRTYNIIVPEFLNLPNLIFGKGAAPKDIVGLSMYAASRAAECAYCSAHTGSFAMRRGASVAAVQGADRSPLEEAAVAVAEAIASDQQRYDPALGVTLRSLAGDRNAEWIVGSIAMMGFLNKFMDTMGVELEQAAVDDTYHILSPTGFRLGKTAWGGAKPPSDTTQTPPAADNLLTMAKLVRNAPGAIRLGNSWKSGLPKEVAALGAFIKGKYGWDDHVITSLSNEKIGLAIGTVLRQNLDPALSVIGIDTKALMGLVYANHVANDYLATQAKQLARFAGVDENVLTIADGYFPGATAAEGLDAKTKAALTLAWAMAPSPTLVDADIVAEATANLEPAEIVEAAVWVSVNQAEHRLSLYLEI